MHDNTAYTLFSVSRYGNDNKGAIMHVEID